MWTYEPDESPRKRKHHWKHNYAGVVVVHGIPISKCPANLSIPEAQELLDEGFAFYPRRSRDAHPSRIYAVKDGVVYRATPTVPGRSYHGFPELKDHLPPGKEVREAILALAEKDGSQEEVEEWLAD